MKTLSRTDTSITKDTTTARSPIKVCMHVLGRARTDVRVMRAATALMEAGFEVSIVDVERDRTLSAQENIRGIKVKHIISPDWYISTHFKPWFLFKLALMIIVGTVQLLRIQAEVYHAHDELTLPAAYIAARLRHKLLIFDAHELLLSDPIITRRRRLRALSIRLLVHITSRCTGVITTSPLYAQEIRNLYHVPEVSLIRNMPPYQTVPKSDRLRQHLGLSPDIRIALYQGVLQPNRELHRVIRAAPFLEPNIIIVIMGPATKATQSQLEALIASEGVVDRVRILPPVPYEELLDWTASADIGLIVYSPDYSLGVQMCLPNKLFEYLMAGLPVLSSQLEAVGEIIRTHDVGRIVPSLSPTDVGAAINAMLADQIALDGMHHNALKAAREEFHWEKESQELVRLYHDFLASGI